MHTQDCTLNMQRMHGACGKHGWASRPSTMTSHICHVTQISNVCAALIALPQAPPLVDIDVNMSFKNPPGSACPSGNLSLGNASSQRGNHERPHRALEDTPCAASKSTFKSFGLILVSGNACDTCDSHFPAMVAHALGTLTDRVHLPTPRLYIFAASGADGQLIPWRLARAHLGIWANWHTIRFL